MSAKNPDEPDPTRWSASAIAAAVASGAVSAREVTDAHIRRIEAVNGRLNAVVIPLFTTARAEADAVDAARAKGEHLGPLAGVPVTVKEQFKVRGTDTTFGVRRLAGKPYADEGPLVSRLRVAGAVILGKTNVSQLLLAFESDNALHGRTNNPWNLARSPGGSSGGEGAILAAGGAPLGLGGDLGGSIRIPSHFCGISGLKPTSRRFSNTDTPFEPVGAAAGQEAILAQPGPMSRRVSDLRIAMRVFTRPGGERFIDAIPPVPWSDPADVDLHSLKIGHFADNGVFRASPAVRRAVDESVRALESRGAAVLAFTPPDVWEAVRLFVAILTADGGNAITTVLDGESAHRLVRPAHLGAKVPRAARGAMARVAALAGQSGLARVIPMGGSRTAEEFWQLSSDLARYRKRFLDEMDRQGLDAIVCPPFATVAPVHLATEQMLLAASYAFLFNVTGMPAGVVAATRVAPGEESSRPPSRDAGERAALRVEDGSRGMPVGVQIAAPHWREDTVLTVMAALEEHFRGQLDYPNRDALPM